MISKYDWGKHLETVAVAILCCSLLVIAGCADTRGDDYGDAPTEIQDGSLDYQDYKEAGCPYLDGSLDQETMEKCNEWIRNQQTNTTTPTG